MSVSAQPPVPALAAAVSAVVSLEPGSWAAVGLAAAIVLAALLVLAYYAARQRAATAKRVRAHAALVANPLGPSPRGVPSPHDFARDDFEVARLYDASARGVSELSALDVGPPSPHRHHHHQQR